MKQELIRMIDNMKRYNAGVMYNEVFGFDTDTEYDALVIAPGWKPVKIIHDPSYKVTELAVHSYVSGYLVEKDGYKAAWAQISSGACNTLDNMVICADVNFRHLIFAGAVGGLTPDHEIGDLCTPDVCISGVYANHYLSHMLTEFKPFERVYPDIAHMHSIIALADRCGYTMRPAPVFCTDSIALEYSHLDEIRATGASLIEMETSTFYSVAELIGHPAVALLAVSDNSATGVPLLGRSDELAMRYNHTRSEVIPDLIFKICAS